MLVLKRRTGESIMVGDVKIKISKIIGSTEVKIAVEGPRDIQVDREEVYLEKRRRED